MDRFSWLIMGTIVYVRYFYTFKSAMSPVESLFLSTLESINIGFERGIEVFTVR
jgi:hypothetical protein